MALYGRRTTIHFNNEGKKTDRIVSDFRVCNGKYVYGNMNDNEIDIVNKKDGYTEIWVSTEGMWDAFEISIYKNGVCQKTDFVEESEYLAVYRKKYLKQYCEKLNNNAGAE